MTTSTGTTMALPEPTAKLCDITFDDIDANLDLIIQKYEGSYTRQVARTTKPTAVANKNVSKEVAKKAEAQQPKVVTQDTPEQIKAAIELQARGINPITGKREAIVMRTVGPKERKKKEQDTAGKGWFDMPKTVLTPEFRKDLQVISMRDALDSKRFYKKDNSSSQVPKYSQVGHIIEGSTEFHSGRLTKKERKRTLVEEVLAEEAASKKHKRKYQDIMAANNEDKALGRKKRRN
ncbi:hypothetical protein MKZ38_006035 [Zalerion maritima]|uniref:Fcf2 pre-rRNA processing C-terminal domain-containing protein n=1 Tax=Zalerion maritima TaxID=339359 RepID=A0AAD5RJX9_9PEZI|nr:hypothetical protein MKZ38_006035 [Zalerion maritima]